jgi:cytochrome c oxidase subunit II
MSLLIPLLASGSARADGGSFWMPPQASTFAADVDWVFYFIYWVDLVFFVALMGAMLMFAVKYRQRKEGEKTHPIKGSHSLELAWAVLPSFLLVAFFWVGFKTYLDQVVPPADAMEVRVQGQKWAWTYSYPEHGIQSDVLIAPAGVPVALTMSSTDVLHSFFVPDFRMKKDVLPNRYTVQWFEAPAAGEHVVFCTEYCGTGHSKMLSKVQVLPPAEFDAWVNTQKAALSADPSTLTAAQRGEKLFKANACAGCHSIDGSKIVGPSLKGVYNREVAVEGGGSAVADDNYIRESIMVPGAKMVAGYPPVMPSFQGKLSDAEVNDLIDYLKSISQ